MWHFSNYVTYKQHIAGPDSCKTSWEKDRGGQDVGLFAFFFQVQGQLIYTYCMTEKGGGRERRREGERERQRGGGESNSLSFVYQTHNIKLHACICIS